jgi:hypothetical protein
MRRATRKRGVLAAFAIAVSLSCQTVRDPLPPQAALNVEITDSAVATQISNLPAPQVAAWRIDELSASGITGVDGTYSFLFSGACFYQQSAALAIPFTSACQTSGLTLAPRSDLLTASFRFRISRLELRAAARPDLSPTADPDGDGIPNSVDNCPIIFNPDQANINVNGEILKNGDACSDLDGSGKPTIPDQDQDGVSDFLDNCLWYPSPAAPGTAIPPDSDHDGIGDACERVAPVVLPSGGLKLECDNVTFKAQSSTITLFRLDFGRPGVLTCDSGFTGCTLTAGALKLSLAGSLATFDCHEVD